MNDNELKELNERNLNGEEHLKSKKNGKIFGIIFLIWFFASLIAMFVLSEKNPYYMVMVFGQYFLVFGTIVLFSKGDHKWIAILPVLIGLACIVIPYLMMNPDLLNIKINWGAVIAVLMISIFIIVGAAMVIFPIVRKKKLEKKCNVHVFAKVISHEISYGDSGSELYAPVYQYEYNKEIYEVCTNVYSNVGVKPVGTIVDLMINPNNPKEFLGDGSFSKMLIIMGILFLIVSVPMLVAIIAGALSV